MELLFIIIHPAIITIYYTTCVRPSYAIKRNQNHFPGFFFYRNDLFGIENAFIEAEYRCHRGHKMISSTGGNTSTVYCQNNQWIGSLPKCVPKKRFLITSCENSEKCQQKCMRRYGVDTCSCYKGFRKKGNRCIGK